VEGAVTAEKRPVRANPKEGSMIILGLILLILGIVLGIGILYTIGGILLVVGIILEVLGLMGRAVGGRRHYY
jgi:hypothetical protein